MDKGPYSPHVGLDAALGQLGCQFAQGKGTGANALAQPFGVNAGQSSLFVAPILPGATPPVCCLSFFHLLTQEGLIRSTRAIDRTVSPASARARQRSRMSSECGRVIHASGPSRMLESESRRPGNPDSEKNNML